MVKGRQFVTAALAAALVLALASAAHAQWRGMGRINGGVTDESGAPLDGVTIKATMAGGQIDSKSDKTGRWIVGGVARGEWLVEFQKPGFVGRKVKVIIERELSVIKPIDVALKKE